MPKGIVIHHSADRDLGRVQISLETRGLGYHLIIARDGSITQHAWLDHGVWHAGKALWMGYSPNTYFLSISLLSWGEIKRDGKVFKTWSGAVLPDSEVVERVSNVNGQKYYWDAATPEQLASLSRLCQWCIDNGVPIKNICGHDECAIPKGRKSDPGGVLPMTMQEYRDFLAVDRTKTGGII